LVLLLSKMLTNYILTDILEYIFSDYIDHHSRDMENLNKFTGDFKFSKTKYIKEENLTINDGKILRREVYIDDCLTKEEELKKKKLKK
jgi:hypothetical protein